LLSFSEKICHHFKEKEQQDTPIGYVKQTGGLHVTHIQPIGQLWPKYMVVVVVVVVVVSRAEGQLALVRDVMASPIPIFHLHPHMLTYYPCDY
jgi:hypothetical protein